MSKVSQLTAYPTYCLFTVNERKTKPKLQQTNKQTLNKTKKQNQTKNPEQNKTKDNNKKIQQTNKKPQKPQSKKQLEKMALCWRIIQTLSFFLSHLGQRQSEIEM